MGTLGGLERSYEQDPHLPPHSTYGYARHLGTVDRSSYILPRIRIPDEMMRPEDMTLTPISFHIPRINSEGTTPYSINYIPPTHVNFPPVPPSVADVDEFYGKHVYIPQGAFVADGLHHVEEIVDLQERALNDNTALSFQTILFALLRYPALICTFIAASSLWGRGMNVAKVGDEWGTALASFCTGCAILLFSLLVLSDHRNNYLRAKILAGTRHLLCMVGVGGAVVTIIFSAISIQPIQKETNTCQGCLSPSERLVQIAVMIGASSLILMMALFALVMGCVGVYQMSGLLSDRRAASQAAQRAAHNNTEILHF